MEKLKEPVVAISVANLVGLLAGTAYFYKQMETMRNDMLKIANGVSQLTRKVKDLEKMDHSKGEIYKKLKDQIDDVNSKLESVATMDDLRDVDYNVEDVIAALQANDIDIERITQPRSRRKSYAPEYDDHRRRVDSNLVRNDQRLDQRLDQRQEVIPARSETRVESRYGGYNERPLESRRYNSGSKRVANPQPLSDLDLIQEARSSS